MCALIIAGIAGRTLYPMDSLSYYIGTLHGYKRIYQKALIRGLNVRKEDVRLSLQTQASQGVALRAARRLQGRKYFAKGPNYIWHIDSYDKLKMFGIWLR